jgi:LysM repeat protein
VLSSERIKEVVMKRVTKILLVVSVLAFAVSCAKPPMKAYDDAQAALKGAQGYNAEKCAPAEYAEANKAFQNAEQKMEEAKNHTFKGKYYDEAEASLNEAKAKAAEAEKIAKERKEENDKVAMKLEEYGKEIEALKGDATKYSSVTYTQLTEKYNRAKAYVDDCKPEEAKALMAEIEELLKKNKEAIAAAKAEEIKQAMLKAEAEKAKEAEMYTVSKGDSLWKISDKKYMNPFMWPLIYWANKDKIKDPDLIFPGQMFKVRNDYTGVEKDDAIKFSKNRGPWSLFDGK